jgi:hypothetical protein
MPSQSDCATNFPARVCVQMQRLPVQLHVQSALNIASGVNQRTTLAAVTRPKLQLAPNSAANKQRLRQTPKLARNEFFNSAG